VGVARAAPAFDVEQFIKSRRAWGYTDEQINKLISDKTQEIYVFQENEAAIDVFMAMRPHIQISMAGAIYLPAPTGEVLATIEAITPDADKRDTLERYRIAEGAFLQELNKRAKS